MNNTINHVSNDNQYKVGNKVRNLSEHIGNRGYRITYTAKVDQYALTDVKYNYTIYAFRDRNDLLSTESDRVDAILRQYTRGHGLTDAVSHSYEVVQDSIKSIFGFNVLIESDKVTLEKNGRTIAFHYDAGKLKKMSDLKIEVSRRAEMLS
jgi:hypothetical protein